jgi:hypothetical protein
MQAKHIFVTGSSGGGKTTYLRELHATADAASIFLSTKRESNVSGQQASGRKALTSVVRDASRPADVRVKWLGARYPEAIQIAREWAHAVRERKGWPVQVIVDEVQNAPEMTSKERGPIRGGLHEDRSKGVKWIVSTQDPQDVRPAYSAIKQVKYIVWCGPPNSFHKGFLTYYNLSPDVLPDKPYQYHVIEPSLPPSVAYHGETDATYA